MDKVVFGFPDNNMERLAAALAELLEMPLYQGMSPMVGTFYSSTDTAALIEAVKAGREPPTANPNLYLEYNEPERGYMPPTMAGGWNILLFVSGAADELERIEQRLRQAPLGAQRLR